MEGAQPDARPHEITRTLQRAGDLFNHTERKSLVTLLESTHGGGGNQVPLMMLQTTVKRKAASVLEEGRYVVSPQVAAQILDSFNYPNNRRRDPGHIAKLAAQMKAGIWSAGSAIEFAVLPDNRTFLINGQHRMSAVISADMEIEFFVILNPVRDEAEMHALYLRRDVVSRIRSVNAILASADMSDDLGITKAGLVAAFRAAPLLAANLADLHHTVRDPWLGTPDGRLDALSPWWDSVRAYDKAIDVAEKAAKRKLLTAGIFSIGVATMRYQPHKGNEFWGGIAADDGLKQGDPRKALLKFMRENELNMTADVMQKAASAWNAWQTGKAVTFVRGNQSGPIVLIGTPYSKKRG